jgi:hypothetical protein
LEQKCCSESWPCCINGVQELLLGNWDCSLSGIGIEAGVDGSGAVVAMGMVLAMVRMGNGGVGVARPGGVATSGACLGNTRRLRCYEFVAA